MRTIRVLVAVLALAGFSVAACHSHRGEGPAQRAGAKMDEGLEKLGEKMSEGGQKLQEKARD